MQAVSSDDVTYCFSWRRHALCVGPTILSGLLLTACFPPFDQGWLAWVALVPLLLRVASPLPRPGLASALLLGLTHFLTLLTWLNEIGYPAGVLVALPCAALPAFWLLGTARLWARLAGVPQPGSEDAGGPSLACAPARQTLRALLLAAMIAALWVCTEFVRGHVFTGFPWAQLGISQWHYTFLLRHARWGGPYALSFLIVATNVAAALLVGTLLPRPFSTPRLPAAGVVIALSILAALTGLGPVLLALPVADTRPATLHTVVVQGDLPLRREYTDEDVARALTMHAGLTRAALGKANEPVDLCVWPETAVPAPLRYTQEYQATVAALLVETGVPLLLGTVDYRPAPPTTDSEPPGLLAFNSAFLLDGDGMIVEYYDKTHPVPFGEYVPFSRTWPWLGDLFGMGRNLEAGAEFTILPLPKQVRAGVNICYEDAFPEISRAFVQRGANVLFTLTNDVWYGRSAGPRQHLMHAVFRAVENARPLVRAGNNSDTCLITADGRIVGLVLDPETGDRFCSGFGRYRVPVYDSPPVTLYTRWGDWFAVLCCGAAFLCLGGAARGWVRRKLHLFERLRGQAAGDLVRG